MQDFRKLQVWQKSHRLTLRIFKETEGFPRAEMFGLTSQMRRSASSVGYNIAEGCGRGTKADFARFLQMAMGSASELEYQVLLAKDLTYLDKTCYAEFEAGAQEVKRMLAALLRKVKSASTDD